MKKNLFYNVYVLFLLNAFFVHGQALPIKPCEDQVSLNLNYSNAKEIQQEMEQLIKDGIPGAVMTVYSREGWWGTATGLAKIEDKSPMQLCHLQYIQSIAKTYTAVAVLKLYEQNKIALDTPITQYLPVKYSRYITGAKKITVRMLLNHTSGIPEYNTEPAYVTRLLQHPNYTFSAEEYLDYIEGKALSFVPGTKYSYRNTNYVILALITDAITGDHAKFISENIFAPLGLTQTFYRNEPGYLNYPSLVNSYWDRHSDGIIENASQLQRNNVAALIGDDGIVTTPVEAIKFLKGLIDGKLISTQTLEVMKSWVKDSKGNFTYGLGLDHADFQGQTAYGHSGGGIGAGCHLYYFPERDIYMFIGINLGTVTESPLHDRATKTIDRIYKALLK
jgi:D-alanyl-D-alanine carboxypeptidase